MAQANITQRNTAGRNTNSGHRTAQENAVFDSSSHANNTTGGQRYNSVQEYARTLQQWMWNYQCMASASSFYSSLPFYMPSQFLAPAPHPVPSPGTTTSPPPPMVGPRGAWPTTTGRDTPQAAGHSQGVMRQMGILESDHLELQEFYRSVILSPDDVDLDKVFALTSEIIALEIVNRICITIVETLCLRRGVGVIGGATPGKRILGLCVVSCQDVSVLGDGRVRVRPAQNIGFKRALVRSIVKNFTLAFFFPACLTIFFFHHNRAAYDVISGTIVVQNPENQEH